jgi:hypothetical protein
MKQLSKFHKMSALLGASLLMVTACAPDSLTRGGTAQPIPMERSNDNSATANANEANVPVAGVPTVPGVNSSAQPASASVAASAVNPALVSPLPTPTPRPTAEPRNEIEFTGLVEVIASDMWVVGGRTLAVTAATEIKSGLAIGTQAKVHAVPQADGSLWAREIEPAGDDHNGNGNSNDNDNGNSNDGNGNGNVNSNDDNGNDDHGGNGNVNSNDDSGNDDHGGNGNGNSNDDNGNDDNGGNSNSNDDNGNDNHGGNDNGNHS